MRVGGDWEHQESHSCAGWCGIGTPDESPEARRSMRCALPGFDESRWGPVSGAPRIYMGRLPIVTPTAEDFDPRHPPDDHTDGCPGAWYRCGFANSLAKYERILTEAGFSSNLLADRTSDRLVIEALQYIELERVRARNHWAEVRYAKEK